MTQLQGRRVLVKVGGETVKEPADRARLAADLAQLVAAGAAVVVVHGAGPQITRLGERLGLQSQFVGGRRITDEPMLQAVAMAMCGEVGPNLLAALLGAGVAAVSTPAASAGVAVGKKRPPKAVVGIADPVDFGLVADISAVNPAPVQAFWQAGLLPVLSSLVCDAAGQLLNLNADTLVTSLVPALSIDDVVLVTGVAGVFRDVTDPSSHLPELHAAEIAGLIADGSVTGGMVAKLEEVGQIVRRGAKRVVLVGYKDEGAIATALTGAAGRRTVVTA